jgi:hypothetical protein
MYLLDTDIPSNPDETLPVERTGGKGGSSSA